MHHKAIRLFLAGAVVVACMPEAGASDMHTDKLRPIIAQLIAAPKEFAGRRIEIYGLVVSSDPAGKTFMLQDVSQRPFLVDARSLKPVVAGEQVEVTGRVKQTGQAVSFVASRIKRVQVIAGGGCC